MTNLQSLAILIFGIYNTIVLIYSYHQTKHKKNAYGEQLLLYPSGSFVYGDGIVFGIFWILACITTLLLKDFTLFLLIISAFWLVRSIGETIFWLNMQFSKVRIYEPKRLPLFSIYQNDSIWFFNQIWNQCLTVITLITTIYLATKWISNLST